MEELKPCPLCGEPLIIRKSIVGGEEHFVAYCHCGFEFADDCSMEDFVKECNRRAAPEIDELSAYRASGLNPKQIEGLKQSTSRLQKENTELRAAPENKPLELHFGDGKVGVSTCRPEKSETWNELLLWNPKMQQGVGNSIPIKDGTTTDDVEAYARLFFSNAESAQVVVDALNKIIDSYSENKPLTLEELRGMDADTENRPWVWIEVLKPFRCQSKISAYYQAQFDYTKGEAFCCGYPGMGYSFDYSNYGKTWLSFARRPEDAT